MISSLLYKAARKLDESRGLSRDSICILKAVSGKLDIKRFELGILFIRLLIASLFKLVIMIDYDVIIELRFNSMSLTTSLKKYNVMMT